MNVNPYVVRFATYRFGYGGDSSTQTYRDMQFWAYTAADAMTQAALWIKEEPYDSTGTRVFRITPGVLHCIDCKGELIPDVSGMSSIMFCPTCNHTWCVPLEVKL